MGLKVRDEQGILHDIAGMPTIDSFMSETSSNPVKNRTIYLALQDKVGKSVNDLVNYWNKTDSYSKEEVNALIGQISTMTIEVVATLPTTGISDTTIYWVGPDSETGLYDQYIHSNNTWIKTGDTSINLGDYLTIAAFNAAIADYYTQTEIDTMVDNFYTKTEANALLDAKQDTLTFDNAPTENSTNPVKSGGVYTAINGKQDAFQVQTLGTASASDLGKIYEYLGLDTASLKHGLFYEAKEVIPITDPATYEWVSVPVQNIDNVTIVRSSSTGALCAVTATNNTLGVVKSGTNSDIAQDGSLNVVGVLKETDSSLGDASEHVGESYLYKGATTSSFRKGGIYQSIATEVTPEGAENPSQEGWYVLDDGEYVLTSDSQVESGTTYYTIEWVLISANSTSFNEDDFDISGDSVSLDPSQRIFVGTKAQWTAEQHKSSYSIVNLTDDELSPNSFVDWKSNGELAAKNLLPFDISHMIRINGGGTWNGLAYTYNGVTYTLLSDGTVRVNGTATAYSLFRIIDANSIFLNPSNNYYITGSPSSSTASTYYVYYSELINGSWVYYSNLGNEDTLFTPNTTSTQCVVDIIVRDGQTANNVVFKPMIRLAKDNDNIYQPYAMTNKEMTSYVQAISNPNLLDNPWFTVNQRGFTTGNTNASYTVDRWRIQHPYFTSVTLSNDVITLLHDETSNATEFAQYFEYERLKDAVGKPITLSIMLSNGKVYSATAILPIVTSSPVTVISIEDIDNTGYYCAFGWRSEKPFVRIGSLIANSTISIKAIKLELGSVSTLANDTVPNYQQELAKCQRYFVFYEDLRSSGDITSASKQYRICVFTPVAMRVKPTWNFSNSTIIVRTPTGYSNYTGSSFIAVTAGQVNTMSGNCLMLSDNISTSVGDTNNVVTSVQITNVSLSADL